MSSLLPSTIKRLDDEDLLQEEDISLLERRYSEYNNSNLTVEYELRKDRWHSHSGDAPERLADALLHCPKNSFPGLHSPIQIFLTVRVSSATAECSFSALRKIKSYLRSTMGETKANPPLQYLTSSFFNQSEALSSHSGTNSVLLPGEKFLVIFSILVNPEMREN
jgi:hypothetical protein